MRKSQVDMLVEEGRPGSKYAQLIASNVNASSIGMCQLGITLASLALGWLGQPAVSALFYPLFTLLGVPDSVNFAVSVAIGFCLVTALHIVVGELIPKSLAIFSTEKYALFTAAPLVWFYRLTFPLIMWLFNSITNGVVRLMGHHLVDEHDVYTEEEIRLLIDESTENGLLTDSEQNQVRGQYLRYCGQRCRSHHDAASQHGVPGPRGFARKRICVWSKSISSRHSL